MGTYVDKVAELYRYFPTPFYKLQSGVGKGLEPILDVVGANLNTLVGDVADARQQFLLATALGNYLVQQGVNLDVFKPAGFNMTDDNYRSLIEIISNTSKNVELIFERLLTLFFGPQVFTKRIANVYSINPNLIVCEMETSAIIVAATRSLYGTWFIHESSADASTGTVVEWTYTLTADLPIGSTSLTFSSLPSGIPDYGVVNFGGNSAPTEQKIFKLNGLTMDFFAPTQVDHPSGQIIEGPDNSDDYTSGYIYDAQNQEPIIGSNVAGATSLTVSGVNIQNFPVAGTVYVGTPGAGNFEAKGFTRASLTSTVLNLMGGLAFAHNSGEDVTLPNFFRIIRTTLNQSITKGQSLSQISVANGADFPLTGFALCLNNTFVNKEIIPFRGRDILNNTLLNIDPGYVFQQNHSVGEKVQLMALQTKPTTDGLDWPPYLMDTVTLRNEFEQLLRRVKATGVKIVFQLT